MELQFIIVADNVLPVSPLICLTLNLNAENVNLSQIELTRSPLLERKEKAVFIEGKFKVVA